MLYASHIRTHPHASGKVISFSMFHRIRIFVPDRAVDLVTRALTRTLHFTLTDCIAVVRTSKTNVAVKNYFSNESQSLPIVLVCALRMCSVHLEYWWSIPNVPSFFAHTKYAKSEKARILRKSNSNLSIPMTSSGETKRREQKCMEMEQENVQHFNFIASVSTLLNFIKIHECQCIYMAAGASRLKLFIRFEMFDTPNQHI